MIQVKIIKKGDLIKANRDMWGNFFTSHYGSVNIKIKENTLFVATSNESTILGRSEISGLIDNKIVTITILDEYQLRIIN